MAGPGLLRTVGLLPSSLWFLLRGKRSTYSPKTFPDLVTRYFAPALAAYGFKESARTPHSITFASAKMLLSFGYDRQELHVSLAPLPTDENDDPDYVTLFALFVFLGLIEARDRLFLRVSFPLRLHGDLKRCAQLLSSIEDYLSGHITEYDPIWERMER